MLFFYRHSIKRQTRWSKWCERRKKRVLHSPTRSSSSCALLTLFTQAYTHTNAPMPKLDT
jgi:hypothetical protein